MHAVFEKDTPLKITKALNWQEEYNVDAKKKK